MSIFDIVLLIIIFYFAASGYKSGFIRTSGSLVGLVVGVFFAGRYYEVLAAAWSWLFLGSEIIAKVALFVIIFILTSRLLKLAVYFLDKIYKLLRFIPFSKFVNRLAGGVLGLLEGSMAVGMFLFLVVRYPVSQGLLQAISHSNFAQQLLKFINILLPLLPQTLQNLKILN